jgi:hypothetical protein
MLLELSLVQRMKFIWREKEGDDIWRISLEIAIHLCFGVGRGR